MDAARLEAFARQLLCSASFRNSALFRLGDAVAVTGSVARGNSTSDSDLDLWVLGARSGRFVHHVGGVSVTLLCQRPREAAVLDNLCFYEVDDLKVLHDPRGRFTAIRRRWRQHRSTIRRMIVEATREDLAVELDRARWGSPLHRAAFLRMACWRLCCVWVFLERGWRVPRLHTLRDVLPVRLVRHLDAALGLPSVAACRRALAGLKRVEAEVQRSMKRYRVPHPIVEKARSAPEEAAFLARRELLEVVLPTLFKPFAIGDLRGVELLGSIAPATQRLFQELEPRALVHTVEALWRHANAIERALVARFGWRPLIPPGRA